MRCFTPEELARCDREARRCYLVCGALAGGAAAVLLALVALGLTWLLSPQ